MAFNSTSQRVAANVRAEMARAGESQTSVCPKILLSQAALSRRLCGFTEFTIAELARIADALNVPLTALIPEPVAS